MRRPRCATRTPHEPCWVGPLKSSSDEICSTHEPRGPHDDGAPPPPRPQPHPRPSPRPLGLGWNSRAVQDLGYRLPPEDLLASRRPRRWCRRRPARCRRPAALAPTPLRPPPVPVRTGGRRYRRRPSGSPSCATTRAVRPASSRPASASGSRRRPVGPALRWSAPPAGAPPAPRSRPPGQVVRPRSAGGGWTASRSVRPQRRHRAVAVGPLRRRPTVRDRHRLQVRLQGAVHSDYSSGSC